MKKMLALVLVVLMLVGIAPRSVAAEEVPIIEDIWEVIDNHSQGYDSTLYLFFYNDTQTLTVSDSDYIIEFMDREWGVSSVTDPATYRKVGIDRSVRHLVIEEGIEHISNSFNDMELLESVILPGSVEDIKKSFNGCPNLKSVSFARENAVLEEECFFDCPALQSVTVEGEEHSRDWMEEHLSVKPTVHYEFDEKTSTLTVSGAGTASGYQPREDAGGFEDAGYFGKIKEDHKVKHLVIQSGIVEIFNCFNDMMALETVQLPHSVYAIGDSFQSCEKLKEIHFPYSVKSISGYSFNDCLSLRRITFQGPVKIGSHYQQRTFCNLPKLRTLYLHDGSSVSGYSFCSCKRLSSVKFGGPNVEVADFEYEEHGAAFRDCPRLVFNNTVFQRIEFWLIVFAILALIVANVFRIRKERRERAAHKIDRNPEW